MKTFNTFQLVLIIELMLDKDAVIEPEDTGESVSVKAVDIALLDTLRSYPLKSRARFHKSPFYFEKIEPDLWRRFKSE